MSCSRPTSPRTAERRAARARTRGVLAATASLTLLLGGCVTETSTPASRADAAGDPAPFRPIASPAPAGATSNVRAAALVVPMGRIPYDGLTLPLVAPGGRHLVTRVGPAAPWGAMLAAENAPLPSSAQLRIYDLVEEPRAGLTRRASSTLDAMPGEALLGRCADDDGFSVELPGPDDSRRVGWVSWASGRTAWWTPADQRCADAVRGPGGSRAWSRWDPAARRWTILIDRAGGRREISVAGADLRYPTILPEGIAVLSIESGANAGIALAWYPWSSFTAAVIRPARVVPIARGERASIGYDAIVAAQSRGSRAAHDDLVMHAPAQGGLVAFETRDGRLRGPFRLGARSMGGTPTRGADRAGFIVGGTAGVEFVDRSGLDRERAAAGAGRAPLVEGPGIPRAVSRPIPGYLVLQPAASVGQDNQMLATFLALTPPDQGGDNGSDDP